MESSYFCEGLGGDPGAGELACEVSPLPFALPCLRAGHVSVPELGIRGGRGVSLCPWPVAHGLRVRRSLLNPSVYAGSVGPGQRVGNAYLVEVLVEHDAGRVRVLVRDAIGGFQHPRITLTTLPLTEIDSTPHPG